MKKLLLALTVVWLIICIASWVVYRKPAAPPAAQTAVEAVAAAPLPAAAPEAGAPPQAAAATQIAAPAVIPEETQGTEGTAPPAEQAPASAPALPPDTAMEALQVTFRNYGQRFKGNPVGNNAEITAALRGGNPQQVQFIDAAVHPVNDAGELVDAWGTAYFFHQLSGTEMEIRSAGADKVMWTADDLLTR